MKRTKDKAGVVSRRARPRRMSRQSAARTAALSLVLSALAASALGTPAAYAQEQAFRDFSLVSVMNGKCVQASSPEIPDRASMRQCQGPSYSGQRWTNSTTGELKTTPNRCLATASTQIAAPIKVEPCNDASKTQKWDIDDRGRILLRGATRNGRHLAVTIANGDRSDGAVLWLTYKHDGENQLFRRDRSGAGGSEISIQSDLIEPDPDPACVDLFVDYGPYPGIPALLQDCQERPGQRFTRTPERQLKLFGLCLGSGSGQASSPVTLQDCDGSARQQWNLRGDGELHGINNLCLDAGESNANGTPLRLSECNGFSPGQRWSFRDPR